MDEREQSMFWADQLAEQIIDRAKREGRVANAKCQQTPSGAKHIGNLNDVIRAYFPVKAVLEKGEKISFVHTTDDRDPLKDVPKRLADLDGNWHEASSLNIDFILHLGKPLVLVPDPFGCCKSWAAHFTLVWMRGVRALELDPKLYSVDALYKEGKFEPYIKKVFEKKKIVGKIVSKFQETKREDYIPFDAICPRCQRLANIDSFDLKKKSVHFTCGGKAIKKKKSEGCGYTGEVSWSEGKLQWRFEWPALWGIFNTTFEPFGKDHAEGSWPSGVEIAKKVFEIEPPIPYVYEFFLVNKEKMSASRGNVYIAQDILKFLEKEVFRFFYTKRPGMQRDLDFSSINLLVDEFDHAERIYFGLEEDRTDTIEKNFKRMYELGMIKIIKRYIKRVPFVLAAQISQIYDVEDAIKKLIELGHLEDKKEQIELARIRLPLAKYWALNYAPESVRINILKELPRFEISENVKRALEDVAKEVKKSKNFDELQSLFKEICERNNIQTIELFKTAYGLFLGKKSGPRLGAFLLSLDKEFVVDRLMLRK